MSSQLTNNLSYFFFIPDTFPLMLAPIVCVACWNCITIQTTRCQHITSGRRPGLPIALPLPPHLSHLSAGITLHWSYLSQLLKKVFGSLLLLVKQSFFFVLFDTLLITAVELLVFYSLFYHSSRTIGFSIVI